MSGNGTVMNEWKFREQMCEIGRRVYNKGFAAANDGNISSGSAEDRVLCTPTRVSKGFMKPDDLCIVDLDGKQVSGKRQALERDPAAPDDHESAAPTSARSCTVIRPTRRPSPSPASRSPSASCPRSRSSWARWRSRRTRRPGGQSFADTVLPYVKDTETILLANHGTVTYGTDLEDAYFKTEIIDAYCRILILAKQTRQGQLLHRREGGRADQAQAEAGHPRPAAGARAGELRPVRQQPVPRGLRRLQPRAARSSSIPRSPAASRPVADRGSLDLPDAVLGSPPPTAAACDRSPSSNGQRQRAGPSTRALVKAITDQVMAALNGASPMNVACQAPSVRDLRVISIVNQAGASPRLHSTATQTKLEVERKRPMKVSIIGGGGLVGSSAAFALQCGGVVSQIDLIDLNADQVAARPSTCSTAPRWSPTSGSAPPATRRSPKATSSSSRPACGASRTRAGST